MTTYTFIPKLSTQNVSWNDPSIWSTGVVPNSPDADVIIPAVTRSDGFPYISVIGLSSPPNYSINSLSLSGNRLQILGNLAVAANVTLINANGTELDMLGGNLSAASVTNNSTITSKGHIDVAGTLTNNGKVDSSGLLVLTAQQLQNNGTLNGAQGALVVNVTGAPASNTLTGGTYAVESGELQLNVTAGVVITHDAANILYTAAGQISSFDSATSSYIPLESSLQQIDPSGALTFSPIGVKTYNWAALTDQGALTIRSSTTFNTPQLTVQGGQFSLLGGTFNSPNLTVTAGGTVLGDGTINAAISNAGTIKAGEPPGGFFVAAFNTLTINGAVSGAGTLVLSKAATISPGGFPSLISAKLELNGPVAQNVAFEDGLGILSLGDVTHFTGSIAPLAGDSILLPNLGFDSVASYSYSGDSTHGVLRLDETDGSHIDLAFNGNFDTHSFKVTAVAGALSSIPPTVKISGFAAPSGPYNVDIWFLKNGQWSASLQPDLQAAGFSVGGVADLNGDKMSDIVWYNQSTGDVQYWIMSKGGLAVTTSPGSYPNHDSKMAGIGDFNHDGAQDILWFSPTTNQTDIWELNGTGGWRASVAPGPHPAGYQVAGVTDLNGDGTSDIIWFNPTTGDIDEWKMLNGKWAGSTDVGLHPGSGWQASGLGDFNHDGTRDIFWYRPGTGETDIWELAADGKWLASVQPGPHPLGYEIGGIADVNGDGSADVLFFNPTTHHVDEWKLVNGQWTASVDLGVHPGSAHMAGIGDVLGTGTTTDVLWY
jgi:hypothetical protein